MTKVAIILIEAYADWEYALLGGTGGPYYGLDVQYFSPVEGSLKSQGGLTTLISQDLDALLAWQSDVAVVIGSAQWAKDDAPDIGYALTKLYDNGAHIGGICGGTLALARAGLLNDVPHTSNEADFLKDNADNYQGAAHYQASSSAISSRRIITAPGTAPVTFTAAIFKAAGLSDEQVSEFTQMLTAENKEA